MIDQERIAHLRTHDIAPCDHLVGGRLVASQDNATLAVVSPIDGKHLTSIAAAGEHDVDHAVGTARRVFERGDWRTQPPAERKQVLLRLADIIESNAYELAVLGSRDNGTEISMALKAEPGSAAATFRYYAEAIDKVGGEVAPTAPGVLGLVERHAIGVVAAIVPWNFPLMIAAWKIAPALALGNSIVLKPAETASLTLLRLAELALEAGLPAGALNVITGYGTTAGRALALHNDVDVVAFTGSGVVGRKLLEYSARSNLKHVYLELGGKSPNIVFADSANLDKAASAAVNGIFRNAGQVCVAGSRLLVQREIHDEFVELVIEKTERLLVGDPLDVNTNVGAINSLGQLEKNLTCVEEGVAAGACRRTGGERVLQSSGGYYMSPAVFTDVTPDMALAREEVFGPVLAVTAFDDEDDAARIANATDYGLAAGVWTSSLAVAHRMIRRIRSGLVHVNCYGGSDLTVPLGGMKQSGNGYDKSLHAFDKYCALKSAWIALD